MAQRQWRSDDTDPWLEGFGNGSDGDTYAVPANEGCSGTDVGTSVTLAAAGDFSDGDLVIIHQTRGSNYGHWELNKIVSGGGGTSLTMKYALTMTYTDSGASQAQMIELNQYSSFNPGSVTAPLWNHSDGGIIAFLCSGVATIDGALSANGRGLVGNTRNTRGNNLTFYQGESGTGAGAISNSANGMAGGGASTDAGNQASGGGGGGHKNSGSAGQVRNSSAGAGGGTGGTASLVTMVFGGGGGEGGAQDESATNSVAGARSGGIIFIAAKNIILTGTISVNGANGANVLNFRAGSGGGAGGSILLKAQTAVLGSGLGTSAAGTGGTGGDGLRGNGGNGSVGRIHLDYSSSYTGTTTPTLDVTKDSTIIPLGGGAGYANFI